jgi:hypothetical protein
MSDVTLLEPLDEHDSELDQRIMSLRAAGKTTGQIARELLIAPHQVHARLDAILPVIDASYRRRAIAESLMTIDSIIAAHMPTVRDCESASILIRATCEKRALLGIGGSTDPVLLSQQSRSEHSLAPYKRGLAFIENLRRLAEEKPAGTFGSDGADSDK